MSILPKFEKLKHFNTQQESFDSDLEILNNGNGFVINELTNEKFFIKKNYLKGALKGDRVAISIKTFKYRSLPICRIEKVLNRKSEYYFVKVIKYKKQVFASIYPFQAKKIIVKFLDMDLNTGDIIKIKITDWREGHKSAYARAVKLIAKSEDPDSDYIWISRKYEIDKFKPYVLSKVEQKKYEQILKSNLDKRVDLSQLRTFTIDPKDAKDFDDAISITKQNIDTELYVHIADVSSYVQESSKIDQHALERGNSYYFREKTIHMLPENLSTNICSLVPGKKRLALTVKIILNDYGHVKSFDFFESIILSDRKFHYSEVEKILTKPSYKGINADIKELKILTDKLRINRLSKDGFNLDLSELDFELDKNGNPIDSYEVKKLISHGIIEESMLLANTLAAKQIEQSQEKPYYFGIYRNHENVSIKNENFLKALMNYTTKNLYKSQSILKASDVNVFLNQLGVNQKKALSRIIVRKMKKANYSTKSLGHYGLGLKSYTHFTSPIRRYSDIVAHRIIKSQFKDNDNIFNIVHQCNNGEVKAQNAEREYMTLKGLKLLEHRKDDFLYGYITKIQRSRIIVNEKHSGVDGIILKQHIPQGSYEFHREMLYMRNKNGLEEFMLGDKVKIKVVSIDSISQAVFFSLEN